jgi:hypothetical protein
LTQLPSLCPEKGHSYRSRYSSSLLFNFWLWLASFPGLILLLICVYLLISNSFQPWKWRQFVPSKLWHACEVVYDKTKITIWIVNQSQIRFLWNSINMPVNFFNVWPYYF